MTAKTERNFSTFKSSLPKINLAMKLKAAFIHSEEQINKNVKSALAQKPSGSFNQLCQLGLKICH